MFKSFNTFGHKSKTQRICFDLVNLQRNILVNATIIGDVANVNT